MINPLPDNVAKSQPRVPSPLPMVDETDAFTPTNGGILPLTPSVGDPLIGTRIGRYILHQKLGEGGMGSVYLAEQSEPVKRQVALKLIRGGVDSRTVNARFEAERQALAMMDHPNIARIYDGGTTSALQPFFVMELVQGIPITAYCDQHRLSPQQRLELFVPICHAVQHAHQKGIIHRDLKPSNVLVSEVDGKAVPKVIDFGVAKATEQPLTDQSMGDTGAIVGTPTYMSPEQADPHTMDIDTRTDIYALGVMLYELLTGSTPIDVKQFRHGALLEVLRMVREVDPPRPSTKLITADALPSIAASRRLEPKQLQAMLRNDIDWIVMKAIEKDRSRRYETANGFAADVQRYLSGEAVLAHPPSRWYLVKKFVRRNRIQVIAAGLVIAALVTGIIGTSIGLYQANEATKAEREAKIDAQEQKNAAVKANELTQRRLKQIEKGVDILALMLMGINPRNETKGGPTVYEMLADRAVKAAEQLDAESIGDPLAVARLQTILGTALYELGELSKAIEVLSKARVVIERELGVDNPDTLTMLNALAMAYYGSGKTNQAIPLFEKIRDAQMKIQGTDHPHTLGTLNNLAKSYQEVGKITQAIEIFEQLRDSVSKKMGAEHPHTLVLLSNLAMAYQDMGKLDKAIELFEKTRDAQVKTLGMDHADTLTTLTNLAQAYRMVGRKQQALELYEQSRDAHLKKLGPNHPETLVTLSGLASTYQDVGKLSQAIELFEQVREAKIKQLGADHPDTLTTLNNLAMAYRNAGKKEQAMELYEKVREAQVKKLGGDHPDTVVTINNLGMAYFADKNMTKALPLFEQVAQSIEKQNFQHQHSAIIMQNTCTAYDVAMQFDKSEPWRRKWAKVLKARSGPKSSAYSGELALLGLNLLTQKKWADAETTLRECLDIREKHAADVWSTFNTHTMLGGALMGQKKYAEAEPLLLKGYEGLLARVPKGPTPGADATRLRQEELVRINVQANLERALDRLIQYYTETNKPNELKKWQADKDKLPKPEPTKK